MFIPTLDAVLVGKVIAAFRNKSGISQEVLSGLADIGRSHLSAIERGERKPTLNLIPHIQRLERKNEYDRSSHRRRT